MCAWILRTLRPSKAVRDVEGVRVDSVSGRTLLMEPAFEIETTLKLRIKTRDRLSMAYVRVRDRGLRRS